MYSKRVAIIGAGTSGLTSAKYALQNGIKPIVFEKSNKIGGLWSGGSAIWDGLFTNISIYTMMFSDHPWPKNSTIFQSVQGVHKYLTSYAERFKLTEHLKLNSKVEEARQLANKKWQITSVDTNSMQKRTEIFDFLMVSTGLHAKPKIPQIEDSHLFQGIQIHSSEFKLNDPKLKSKKVIVLGCSLSGTEISASLVNHAQSVTNIFPRAYLVLPRLVKMRLNPKSNLYSILPIDLLINKRILNYPDPSLSKEKIKEGKKLFFQNIASYQTNKSLCNQEIFVDLDSSSQELLFSISDEYIPSIREGKIKPIKSRISKFLNNGVLLENGLVLEADAVVYCTGYYLDNSFLEQNVLDTMKYSKEEHKYSILLYKSTFHPDLENFAMVGQTDGYFFGGDELQARWASMIFSGKLNLPERQIMMEFINKEEAKRNLKRKSQYPYGNYVECVDRLAKEINLLPDMNELKLSNPQIFEKFWNSSVVTSNYIFKENPKLALDVMDQVEEMNKRVYKFDCADDQITLAQVAKKFSQFYPLPNGMFKI